MDICYLGNGCSDNMFYMVFETQEVAEDYIALCIAHEIGTAYPQAGWEFTAPWDDLDLKVVTAEHIQKLLATSPDEQCDAVVNFEAEYGAEEVEDDEDDDQY